MLCWLTLLRASPLLCSSEHCHEMGTRDDCWVMITIACCWSRKLSKFLYFFASQSWSSRLCVPSFLCSKYFVFLCHNLSHSAGSVHAVPVVECTLVCMYMYANCCWILSLKFLSLQVEKLHEEFGVVWGCGWVRVCLLLQTMIQLIKEVVNSIIEVNFCHWISCTW